MDFWFWALHNTSFFLLIVCKFFEFIHDFVLFFVFFFLRKNKDNILDICILKQVNVLHMSKLYYYFVKNILKD